MSPNSKNDKWWETTPLDQMSDEQWEEICDGCGKCCLIKIWHNNIAKSTKVGCELLSIKTAHCSDYTNRFSKVKNCIKVTIDTIDTPGLLPDSCAYKRLKNGLGLYDWHHLISGDRNAVISRGYSVVDIAETTKAQIDQTEMENYFLKAVDYFDQK